MEGDTLVTVVVIILAAGIMVIFPLMTMADRTDDVTQLVLESALAEFADEVSYTAVITEEQYDKLVQTLAATGNTYDLEFEIKTLDENPGKKTAQVSPTKYGKNEYYSVFTEDILEEIETNGSYKLTQGSFLIVKGKNDNMTLADQFHNFLSSVTGSGNYANQAEKSVMITGN